MNRGSPFFYYCICGHQTPMINDEAPPYCEGCCTPTARRVVADAWQPTIERPYRPPADNLGEGGYHECVVRYDEEEAA